MNASLHPRYPYQKDISALGKKFLVLIGAEDEANDPAKYPEIMHTSDQSLQVLEGVKHLDIVCNAKAMQTSLDWIQQEKKRRERK